MDSQEPTDWANESLIALIEELRQAEQGELRRVLLTSKDRVVRDESYAAEIRGSVRKLLSASSYTHLCTDAGILDDRGLGEGILERLGGYLAPAPANALDAMLKDLFRPSDVDWLRALPLETASNWAEALGFSEIFAEDDPSELSSAVVILATRVAGAGLDSRLTERLPALEDWHSPFIELPRAADRFAELHISGPERESTVALLAVIDRCDQQLRAFRANKKTLGTTLHLSSASLRMRQQLERLRLLVSCTQGDPAQRLTASVRLALELLEDYCAGRPVMRFVREKLDLLSYLAVGHAAQKGDRYAARSGSDFARFLYKATLGGFLVAIFACLKIHLSHEGLAPLPQGLVYGANYALCFVLIYLLGATLATKQPALTASRLAASLESDPGREQFAYLVRAIWRAQFVCFVGNVVGAVFFAALFAWGFAELTGQSLVSESEARALAAKNHPLESLTILYACIAGVLLSASGLLAGFVDNAVIFHRLGDRLRAGSGAFRFVPALLRGRLAERVDHELGDLTGNVVLGFMLGSAGVLGAVAGLPIDIRHIAFSSSHVTLAVLYAPELSNVWLAAQLLIAVLLIGLFNFIVSFGLTLFVAATSRQIEDPGWLERTSSLWTLVKSAPLQFFFPLRPDPPSVRFEDEG